MRCQLIAPTMSIHDVNGRAATDTDNPPDRHDRAVLVVDLVESVRLMQQHEARTIQRWRHFVAHVQHELPTRWPGARIVKSLGDGLLLDFDDAPAAADAALVLVAAIEHAADRRPGDETMQLRAGATYCSLVVDREDVFGSGVNLAARLAALARPGQVVVSEAFRLRLRGGLDADAEDLGEHYLKHIDEPVRAFALHRRGSVFAVPSVRTPRLAETAPTLAVLPFDATSDVPAWQIAGDLLTEDLTAMLARSPAWQVTSRLSSAQFAGRRAPLAEVSSRLGVRYVVSGSVHVIGDRLRAYAELSDARQDGVLWADHAQGPCTELVEGDGDMLSRLASAIGRALIERELACKSGQPWSALHERSLLLQAMTWMHQISRDASLRAFEALEHVASRHPRHAAGHAWTAKWHLIQLAQAWSANPHQDASRWRQSTRRALDADPSCALALALEGHACVLLDRDLPAGTLHLDRAVESSPNEPMAWLFRAALLAYRGDGAGATAAIGRADAMSPLDPMRYFFDAFAALAAIADERPADALALARRSVRLNSRHLSSWLMLAIAAAESGRTDQAREAGERILAMNPRASVARFAAGHPAADAKRVQRDADALRLAGLPD